MTTQPRGLFERMTKPTEQDLGVSARLSTLGRQDVMRMVDHFRQVMEHLAGQRDDVTVTRDGEHGFSVRVNTDLPDNPLIIGPDGRPSVASRPGPRA